MPGTAPRAANTVVRKINTILVPEASLLRAVGPDNKIN